MPSRKPTSNLTAALLLAALAGSAHAQNALGDGRALDANPGQYGPGNYQRPSLMDELRFRNAIATGNAPGGLSFRGDIGYRAPGEFTGSLGSDSLFAFRRDSFYSGLAGMGIRGTDALQYQFALTTGANPPRNLMGNLNYTRDDQYSTSANYSTNANVSNPRYTSIQTAPLGVDQTGADLDTRGRTLSVDPTTFGDAGSMLGTLRSASTYTTTSTLQPSLMSVYEQGVDRKPMGLISSPLLGVTTTPLADDEPKAANPLVARPITADTDPTVPGDLPSTRVVTSYDQIVEDMRARAQAVRDGKAGDSSTTTTPGETNDAWLGRQMEDLRQKLYGTKPANNDAPADATNTANAAGSDQGTGNDAGRTNPADPNDPANPSDGAGAIPPVIPPLLRNQGNTPRDDEPKGDDSKAGQVVDPMQGAELYDPTQIAIDPDTLEVLRGSAAKEVEQLLDPNADTRNIYAEHMSVGQELIQQGRYFDAEERFTHALSIRPGDVSAQLGRFHAQIGAGMLLSASVNLQSLFTLHPELVATRYSGELLPGDERMADLKTRLRERAGLLTYEHSSLVSEGERVRVSAGLLLSYLGYQSGDQEAMDQGLGVVRQSGTDADKRFASLLAQLWDAHPTLPDPAKEPAGTPKE